jgi:hypothetical protein
MQPKHYHQRTFLFLLLGLLLLSPAVSNAADVTLAWDANTEEDLAGYQLYYGFEPGVYNAPIDVGNVITYTIPGLLDGQRYYFAATAYDTAEPERNESDFSEEISYVTPGGEPPLPLPVAAKDATVTITCIVVEPDPVPIDLIIDDGGPGTSGNWGRSGAPGYYGSDSVYDQSGTVENPSTYTFEADVTGKTNIALWWTVYPNPPDARCGNVPVDIFDGDTLLYTAYVNQQQNGGRWNNIGDYTFTGSARVVIRSEAAELDANGEPCGTVADAVRFRK